jgi:hypothetical protein
MADYYGDIRLGNTIDIKFWTEDASGAPITLAGTPAVAAYVGNSTTEITAGITLTVDFDSRTGLHNVRVVATALNGYGSATDVALALTAGTVSGVSAVGKIVGAFSIENRGILSSDVSTPDDVAAAVLSAAAVTPIAASVKSVVSTTLQGVGTSGNPWRPA